MAVHASVKQIQRIIEIDRRLRQNRPFKKTDFARECGVAERTIRRDLNTMREALNLPIAYDEETAIHYYSEPVAELPGTLVSQGDRLALLLSLKAMEQYKATPLYKPLQKLYRRLLDLLPPERQTDYAKLASKIRFEGSPIPAIDNTVWETLLNCIEVNETLRMTYRTGRTGQIQERELDPYGLIVRDRHWYVVGLDHLAGEVRTFAVQRIQKAEYTDKRFKVREDFMDRYLSTAVDGQQSTGPIRRVNLRLSCDAPPALAERIWTRDEKRSQDKHGRLVIEFQTGALYEVERSVLAAGGLIEVIGPKELRNTVHELAAATAAAHG